jgi:Phage integrase family
MWQQRRLLESWLANLTSAHSRRNFEVTARRFLSELPAGRLRAATVEDVRDALARITADVSEVTGRQYVLRVKSLLGYAHRLGYAPFNAGATIRVRFDARNRGATFASRKTDVRLTERAVLGIVKRAAARAGLEAPISPHWLRHAHASHAIDRGSTLSEVQSTLGHGNIATDERLLARAAWQLQWPAPR